MTLVYIVFLTHEIGKYIIFNIDLIKLKNKMIYFNNIFIWLEESIIKSINSKTFKEFDSENQRVEFF